MMIRQLADVGAGNLLIHGTQSQNQAHLICMDLVHLICRTTVVETIQFKLQYHKDKERAEQVKQIKGW